MLKQKSTRVFARLSSGFMPDRLFYNHLGREGAKGMALKLWSVFFVVCNPLVTHRADASAGTALGLAPGRLECLQLKPHSPVQIATPCFYGYLFMEADSGHSGLL